MRIVALETSGRHGSLAALTTSADGLTLLRQVELARDQRTAQVLAPRLRQMLSEVDWPPKSVDLVAVANGPGSFTGLRLGVTTAKVFAYAVDAEIVAVNTLAAIASQVPQSPMPVWTIMDAQRQELFAAKFTSSENGQVHAVVQTQILSQEAWIDSLQPGERVSGPALHRLAARLPAAILIVPEDLWQPTAATVGCVAWNAYRNGQRDDVWQLAPAYYRASAAEEKAAARLTPHPL
jgi:tRNA threonylcarbamoyladenosine biosynthesis protein TsaB